jgi:hypothetical protein
MTGRPGKGLTSVWPVLGFTKLALGSREKSYAYYPLIPQKIRLFTKVCYMMIRVLMREEPGPLGLMLT